MGLILFRLIMVASVIGLALYARHLARRFRALEVVQLDPSDYEYVDDDRPTDPSPESIPTEVDNEIPAPDEPIPYALSSPDEPIPYAPCIPIERIEPRVITLQAPDADEIIELYAGAEWHRDGWDFPGSA